MKIVCRNCGHDAAKHVECRDCDELSRLHEEGQWHGCCTMGRCKCEYLVRVELDAVEEFVEAVRKRRGKA